MKIDLERADKALLFMIVITFGVFATGRLMGAAFRAIGWTGPASIFLGS